VSLSPAVIKDLHALPMEAALEFWTALESNAREKKQLNSAVRELIKADLFYLLVRACRRVDLLHPWLYARCREVEKDPDGRLDLWAREHGKTSIVTFGKTIQDILTNPEITFGIFSHTRPIAKAFLRMIMRELESNTVLHEAFPDVLWGTDVRKAPKWSEDDGIIVKRKSNPNEATVEAWGLIDGQPTSKHFRVLLYDDIVVQASVTTPDMIAKTMTALEQSYNVGTVEGARRFCGTRWHFNDAYRTVLERESAIRREYPGREGGTEDGESVYWPNRIHAAKRRDMGPYTYAAQILLNPKADNLQGFKRDWVKYYRSIPEAHSAKMNKYILVDAASSKKKRSDFTAMWVIGLASDGNYYALDMIRDRLNLTERGERLFELHRKWKPKQVRYEKYGLAGDIEHMHSRMEAETYRFQITEVAGSTNKIDRIGRLMPIFEQGKIYLPRSLHKTNYEKVGIDLVQAFIEEEYVPFPVGLHDDLLDSLARIAEPDLKLVWPKEDGVAYIPPQVQHPEAQTAWMA